jgi:dihydrofolate reductase
LDIALIVAAAQNNVIGRDNQLPWRLPADLQHFRAVTWGKPIIMGRKTYESIGKPLPGRINIVVTRQQGWAAEGVMVAHDVPAALVLAQGLENPSGEIMIIGGAQIYVEALPLARRIYLTRLGVEVEGDAYFPVLQPAEWRQVESLSGEGAATLPHEFQIWERIAL